MATKETKKENFVNTLLNDVTKNLKTNAGKNESIYKKEIYENLDKSKHKNLRTKLRKISENFAKSILSETNKDKLQSLIKDFCKYYKEIYLINDYSVNSICSNNTDEQTKENYKKMFEKIQQETQNNK